LVRASAIPHQSNADSATANENRISSSTSDRKNRHEAI